MRKTILLNIIFATLFLSCSSQKERLENKLMECVYRSYEDDGTKLAKLISDYENLLVNEGILKDNTGSSYRKILQNIAKEGDIKKTPSKFFQIELQKIGKPNGIKLQECQKALLQDSVLYDISKFKSLEKVIVNTQKSFDLRPDLIAKDYLNILTNNDFELDFYKLRTYFLFEIMNTNDRISRKLPELRKEKPKSDLSKALKIYLTKKNEILVDNKNVNLEELKKLVQEYEFKNKSESIISLRNNRNAMYKRYMDIQNAIIGEINNLREKLAKEKYNTTFNKLTKEQAGIIKKIYPENIVE